jgi:serine/threonine protein kinase
VPARQIGIYELLAELGEGTSATVYLARTPKGELVAVKVLRAQDASNDEARERFSREALMAGRIGHPAIVRPLDVGEDHGLPYIVMEYVAGMSLRERLLAGPLAVPEATRILAQIARAMHAAHAAGVIHRDLKPANILLDRAGKPHVSDFGLARDQYARRNLTRDGDLIGTPYYMSPDQVRAEPPSPATDVWGLGVLIYECVTGKRPFEGKSVADVARAITSAEPLAPSRVTHQVPRALDLVCLQALSKDARARPSMEALARDLEAISSGEIATKRSGLSPLLLAPALGVGFALGAFAFSLRAPRASPISQETAQEKKSSSDPAAIMAPLKESLERIRKEKVQLEEKIAKLEGDASASKDLRAMLVSEREVIGRELPYIVDRALVDLEALPSSNATRALRARLLNHRARFRETLEVINAATDDL